MTAFKKNFNERLKIVPKEVEQYFQTYIKEECKKFLVESGKEELIEKMPDSCLYGLPEELKKELPDDLQWRWGMDLLKTLDTLFQWDEETVREEVGDELYQWVITRSEEYAQGWEEHEREGIESVVFNELLHAEYNRILHPFVISEDSIVSEMSDVVSQSSRLWKSEKIEQWELMEALFFCIRKDYVKKWWDKANQIYKEEAGRMIGNDIHLIEILSRHKKLCKLMGDEIAEWDNRFWKDAVPEEKIPGFVEWFTAHVFSETQLWKLFMDTKAVMNDNFQREVYQKLLMENECRRILKLYLGADINEFDISLNGNPWEQLFMKKAYQRCVENALNLLFRNKVEIPGFFRNQSYQCSQLRDAINNHSDEALIERIIKQRVRDIFKEKADIVDLMTGEGRILAGLLYEIRYEIESNVRKRAANKLEVDVGAFVKKDVIGIYDRKSGYKICCQEKDKYVQRFLKYKDCVPKNISANMVEDDMGNFFDDEVYGYLSEVFQERLRWNKEACSIINGRRNIKGFSRCFNEIFLLKENLSDYEQYIIEKQSGLYLAWMIYIGTVKFQRSNDENELREAVCRLTKCLSSILNADIRLSVTQEIIGFLQEMCCMEDMDIVQCLFCVNEEVTECVENFNSKYNIVYDTVLYSFAKESMGQENLGVRYDALSRCRYRLSDAYSNLDRRLEAFYQSQRDGISVRVFRNVLYDKELTDLFNGDTDNVNHKWFRMIYENIERREGYL